MANRSYLCGTDVETTYPNFVDDEYDSEMQTIANDVYCIPLLWIPLFRNDDMVIRSFDVDGESVQTVAPLAPCEKAVRQLRAAVPHLDELFMPCEGSLSEHAEYLVQAIEETGHTFVTIELEEIACLATSEEEFFGTLRSMMDGIGPRMAPTMRDEYLAMCEYRIGRPFPPARFHLYGMESDHDDDDWNHCRICGAGAYISGLGRRVPWEPINDE